MIVKMKKVSLVVLDSERSSALDKLRDLGVMHVEREYKSSDDLASLMEKKALFERCLLSLKGDEGKNPVKMKSFSDAEELVDKISAILEEIRILGEEKEKANKDILMLEPWGDFNPADIIELGSKGIDLGFYELTNKIFSKVSERLEYFPVKQIKELNYIAVLESEKSREVLNEVNAVSAVLPESGLESLRKTVSEKETEIEKLEKELEALSVKKQVLTGGIDELDERIGFESINADMGLEDAFAYISGFVPVDRIDDLKKSASDHSWALVLKDPEEEEQPPTLLRNPKWVTMIKALFGFLDITPGYREADISMFFLMFFTVFVAMIVGDAGYGLIFLGMAVLFKLKIKNMPGQVFALLFVLSFATVIWGTITGTWFGSAELAKIPVLSMFIIPEIASFGPADTSGLIKEICFYLGMAHLMIGLFISFIRKMPSLVAIADIGWMLILVSAYFAARFFVLASPMSSLTMPIFIAGFVLVVLFSEQSGNVFKGILMGVAWSPMKILDSVTMFSNLVSYIRLFAVGLATVAVAQSFNTMASGFEGISGMIISAVILFVAHAFNMCLALLSIIVHGVRLNTLEFGGAVGLEWSGYGYAPFKKNK